MSKMTKDEARAKGRAIAARERFIWLPGMLFQVGDNVQYPCVAVARKIERAGGARVLEISIGDGEPPAIAWPGGNDPGDPHEFDGWPDVRDWATRLLVQEFFPEDDS